MLSLVLAFVPLAPAVAQVSLTNTATVTPAPSVVDGDTSNNRDDAVVDVTTAATYDFCPAGGEVLGISSGGDVWRL